MLLLALAASGQDTLSQLPSDKQACAVAIAPWYRSMDEFPLAAGYRARGEVATVARMVVDSLGKSWFGLLAGADTAWSPAEFWRFTVDSTAERRLAGSRDETDRKRRVLLLAKHPEWPRRILRAVREGEICLGMNPAQIVAAWTEPAQKSRSFLLGIGEVELWLFQGHRQEQLGVFLRDGQVIGWTEQGGAE